jgi:hypothetical protein
MPCLIPVQFDTMSTFRRKSLRGKRAALHIIILLTIALLFTSIASAQSADEQETKKRRGSDNMTLGLAKSSDKETGNFGLLKSVNWNIFSDWISGGINFGIIKNEILLMGNVSLNIPLKRIEPFVTAGYGIIIERFSLASNYGGGIRILLGKHIGVVTEYRKLQFKYKDKQRHTQTTILVDYFGAGIFYYF